MPDDAGDGGRLADRAAGVGADRQRRLVARPPPPTSRPTEPPGIRARSHGLCVGPYAEFSVDEPIANSSMLVLPSMTMPASLIRRGDRRVVRRAASPRGSSIRPSSARPSVTTTSFIASGTPASGPSSAPGRPRGVDRARPPRARPSVSTCRNAWTAGSTARDPVEVRLRHLDGRHLAAARSAAAISAAVSRVRSAHDFLGQDARHPELVVLDGRRAGQHRVARQRRR